MKTRSNACLIILALVFSFLALAANSSLADVTFYDGTFDPSDWELIEITDFPGEETGTITANQVLAGGNPDEYLEITTQLGSSGNYEYIGGFFGFFSGGGYNPQTDGAIISVDYAADSKWFEGLLGGEGTGRALRQAGVIYLYLPCPNGPLLTSRSDWLQQTVTGITAEYFFTAYGYPTCEGPHPDFSITGAPIEFGFFRDNSGLGYQIVAGIDNWTLSVTSETIPVAIDIKPGDDTNIISRQSKGISVAILSTTGFYAPSVVDQATLTFGATGDEASFKSCARKPKDVNGDGIKDLVCNFSTKLTGLQCGTEGILRGETTTTGSFEGSQTIVITPCK